MLGGVLAIRAREARSHFDPYSRHLLLLHQLLKEAPQSTWPDILIHTTNRMALVAPAVSLTLPLAHGQSAHHHLPGSRLRPCPAAHDHND